MIFLNARNIPIYVYCTRMIYFLNIFPGIKLSLNLYEDPNPDSVDEPKNPIIIKLNGTIEIDTSSR